MRWKTNDLQPVGTTIRKRGFLFFPTWIGDECRWLEMATWIEEVKEILGFSGKYYSSWQPIRWVDE